MNTSSPPVVRLEGPFALGHGRLLAMSGNITIRPLTAFQLDWPAGQSEVVFAAGRRGPWTNPGRSRIADFRATVRGYLRAFAWSNLAHPATASGHPAR